MTNGTKSPGQNEDSNGRAVSRNLNLQCDVIHSFSETSINSFVCLRFAGEGSMRLSAAKPDDAFFLLCVVAESCEDGANTSDPGRQSSDMLSGTSAYKMPIEYRGDGNRYDMTVFAIPDALIRSSCQRVSGTSLPDIPKFVEGVLFSPKEFTNLSNLVTAILAINGSESLPAQVSAVLEEAIAARVLFSASHFARLFEPGTRDSNNWKLKIAEDFLRQHMEKPIALDDIARAVGCSRRSLQRIFQHARRSGPIQVLVQMRLSAALQAIESGLATNVAELASSLQFSNPGRFAGLFRRQHGISPAAAIRARATGRKSRSATRGARQETDL